VPEELEKFQIGTRFYVHYKSFKSFKNDAGSLVIYVRMDRKIE